ncbi:universal stress protein [Microbacterium sp. W1N]|uniref:universal stress protein n=1 Tax=Microbacterium festucae TaxID=2977531 RepID=UPI0021C0165D|nr:universal stress protein [Microbacterium festucae]MCT9820845.1 universal stress protein [Microbacterium festucae]
MTSPAADTHGASPARRVVVGYSATKAGRDALAFAARLAQATDAVLDVTVVLPGEGRSVITPHDPSYTRYLREQAQQWIATAIDRIPADVTAHAHVRQADSFAEGLIEVADALEARCIVVGAADGASRGRHRLGATTDELLHSSDVPVVLVPRGTRKIPASTGITRLTVGIGVRPGADALLHDTASLADATGAPVRLLSLLPVDVPVGADTGTIRLAGTTEIAEVLASARATLPGTLDAEVVTAEGDSIQDAVARLDWEPGEVLLVGSSRLAQPRRLFLGSTAAKMLREVPVPVIVVPRTRAHAGGAR